MLDKIASNLIATDISGFVSVGLIIFLVFFLIIVFIIILAVVAHSKGNKRGQDFLAKGARIQMGMSESQVMNIMQSPPKQVTTDALTQSKILGWTFGSNTTYTDVSNNEIHSSFGTTYHSYNRRSIFVTFQNGKAVKIDVRDRGVN